MDVPTSKQELPNPVLVSTLDHILKVRIVRLFSIVNTFVPVIGQVSCNVKELVLGPVSTRLLLWLRLSLSLLYV